MRCLTLSLTNFRNYESLHLDLASAVTVVHGDNASGKTTLLEAFHLLATMRSHRASSDRELINWRQVPDTGSPPFARAATQVERSTELFRIDVALAMEAGELGQPPVFRKRLKINGAPKRGVDAVGVLNVVLFTPEDIALVTGTPSLRRRYLDILISQVDSRYIRTLQHYNKVLLQRNNLLKHLKEQHPSIDPLEIKREMSFWTGELAQAGAYLMARRMAITTSMQEQLQHNYASLSGNHNGVQVSYVSSLPPPVGAAPPSISPSSNMAEIITAAEEIEDQIVQQLEVLRTREIARGMTLIGPHRDDLEFRLAGMDLALYGSRGQQRAVVLALKLAESEVMRTETGEQPVLLLDDILSELDQSRREYVLKAISTRDQQCFITTSDAGQFSREFLGSAAAIELVDGKVSIRA